MGMFGWSYPPGCSSVPGDEPVGPCEVCGGDVDHTEAQAAKKGLRLCCCDECPVCGEVGRPECYQPVSAGGHGLYKSAEQVDGLAQAQAEQEAQARADAASYEGEGD